MSHYRTTRPSPDHHPTGSAAGLPDYPTLPLKRGRVSGTGLALRPPVTRPETGQAPGQPRVTRAGHVPGARLALLRRRQGTPGGPSDECKRPPGRPLAGPARRRRDVSAVAYPHLQQCWTLRLLRDARDRRGPFFRPKLSRDTTRDAERERDMTSKCTLCARADRESVDCALLAGGSLRGLAERYGTSRSSLDRHRSHAVTPTKANGSPPTPANAPASVPPPASRQPPSRHAHGKRGSAMPSLETIVARPLAPNLPAACPPGTTDAMIGELQALVRRHLVRLSADDRLTTFDRSKLEASAVSALGLLARLEGRTDATVEAKVVRHPAVRRVLDAVARACAPWPEAQRAIAVELARFDGVTR